MKTNRLVGVLRAFGESRKSCGACPYYNECGRIGCRMAQEAADRLEAAVNELRNMVESCEVCIGTAAPCGEIGNEECDCDCTVCQLDCRCRECVDEDLWEWRGDA